MPALPHLGELGLDAGVARLAEGVLQLDESTAAAGEVRGRTVLGLPARLQEGVAQPLHVGHGDPVAGAGVRRVHRRHGGSADGLHRDPLAGVALGVDVGDVLPGDVQAPALRVEGGEEKVEPMSDRLVD